MKLVTKDLGLAVDLARDTGVPAELAALVASIHARARQVYGDEAGEMSVLRLYEDAAGVQLRFQRGAKRGPKNALHHTWTIPFQGTARSPSSLPSSTAMSLPTADRNRLLAERDRQAGCPGSADSCLQGGVCGRPPPSRGRCPRRGGRPRVRTRRRAQPPIRSGAVGSDPVAGDSPRDRARQAPPRRDPRSRLPHAGPPRHPQAPGHPRHRPARTLLDVAPNERALNEALVTKLVRPDRLAATAARYSRHPGAALLSQYLSDSQAQPAPSSSDALSSSARPTTSRRRR